MNARARLLRQRSIYIYLSQLRARTASTPSKNPTVIIFQGAIASPAYRPPSPAASSGLPFHFGHTRARGRRVAPLHPSDGVVDQPAAGLCRELRKPASRLATAPHSIVARARCSAHISAHQGGPTGHPQGYARHLQVPQKSKTPGGPKRVNTTRRLADAEPARKNCRPHCSRSSPNATPAQP